MLHRRAQRAFTLVEVVAAITIVGMVLGLGVPLSIKFYESMQFRSAIRESVTLLNSARYAAVVRGKAQDVWVSPEDGVVSFDAKEARFDKTVDLAVHSAKELNRDNRGVIRFYPDGGASGGGLDIARPNGDRVSIAVDWLVGRVTVVFVNEDA